MFQPARLAKPVQLVFVHCVYMFRSGNLRHTHHDMCTYPRTQLSGLKVAD